MGEQLSEADRADLVEQAARLETSGYPSDRRLAVSLRAAISHIVALEAAARSEGPRTGESGEVVQTEKLAAARARLALDVERIRGFSPNIATVYGANGFPRRYITDLANDLAMLLSAAPPPLKGAGRPTHAEACAFADQSDDPIAEMLRKADAANEWGDKVGASLFIHTARLAYATQAISSTGAAPC